MPRAAHDFGRSLGRGATLRSLIARALPRRLPGPLAALAWRACLGVYELADARPLAADLFRRAFGHEMPAEPRHFVVIYFPPQAEAQAAPTLVAYGHQRAFEDVYLAGGMCVDERAYRRFPPWLFRAVRREGGLATILSRGSMRMLGDSPASFGHVGEPRARQADLRTGFVDTGRPHLMVYWRKRLSDAEKHSLIEKVERYGPF